MRMNTLKAVIKTARGGFQQEPGASIQSFDNQHTTNGKEWFTAGNG